MGKGDARIDIWISWKWTRSSAGINQQPHRNQCSNANLHQMKTQPNKSIMLWIKGRVGRVGRGNVLWISVWANRQWNRSTAPAHFRVVAVANGSFAEKAYLCGPPPHPPHPILHSCPHEQGGGICSTANICLKAWKKLRHWFHPTQRGLLRSRLNAKERNPLV